MDGGGEKEGEVPREEHVGDRIRAALDGGLSPGERERVRAHCRACGTCGRAWDEMEALCLLLDADPAAGGPPSLWPEIRERLDRAPARLFRLSFSVGAAAAAIAGLVIGIGLTRSGATAPSAWQQETMTEVGTLLAGGTGTTFDDLYFFADGSDEGGDSR